LQDFRKPLQIPRDDGRSLADQQRLRRINNIIRSQAVVKPPGLGTNDLGHGCGKSDDVVAHLSLNLVDPSKVEIGALTNGFGCVFRYHSSLGESLGSGEFHRQPGAKTVLITPDASHLRAGIAWNQDDPLSDVIGKLRTRDSK